MYNTNVTMTHILCVQLSNLYDSMYEGSIFIASSPVIHETILSRIVWLCTVYTIQHICIKFQMCIYINIFYFLPGCPLLDLGNLVCKIELRSINVELETLYTESDMI